MTPVAEPAFVHIATKGRGTRSSTAPTAAAKDFEWSAINAQAMTATEASDKTLPEPDQLTATKSTAKTMTMTYVSRALTLLFSRSIHAPPSSKRGAYSSADEPTSRRPLEILTVQDESRDFQHLMKEGNRAN
mgnify:CR=1 FL=1